MPILRNLNQIIIYTKPFCYLENDHFARPRKVLGSVPCCQSKKKRYIYLETKSCSEMGFYHEKNCDNLIDHLLRVIRARG